MKSKLHRSVWHPFLYASYTVLALYTRNLGQVVFPVIIRPLLFIILVTSLFLGIFYLFTRDWMRAGLITTWVLFLYAIYGHLYSLMKASSWGSVIARHRYFLPLWGILFVLGFLWLIQRIKQVDTITLILNVIACFLILYTSISIGYYYFSRFQVEKNESVKPISDLNLTIPKDPPDIYYILLDGYTRSDVLAERFRFDNSEFLTALENLGFYIADCSRSNYLYTHLSLPSMLNMTYVDDLLGEIPERAKDERLSLEYLTKTNVVMTNLQSIGYETVAFETSYSWAQFSDADIYFEPIGQKMFLLNLSNYEELYLKTTILSALLDWISLQSFDIIQGNIMANARHHIQISFILDELEKLPTLDGMQLIFAHLIIPHPPYIYNENGLIDNLNAYNETWESGQLGQEGYIDNIRYINQEILVVIEKILNQSTTQPIIIIQSDHGSVFYDRSMNFSAFYFPNGGEKILYPSITPVNTFRLVFNQYFGAGMSLLPDESFTGQYPPFEFSLIKETYPACVD